MTTRSFSISKQPATITKTFKGIVTESINDQVERPHAFTVTVSFDNYTDKKVVFVTWEQQNDFINNDLEQSIIKMFQ